MFYDKVWFCCFPQRHSCHAITTFFKRSAYIFMFNKTNGMVLFHHFSRLFNFFLSILMQFFVKSYLHMSTLYTLIISNEIKFECLKSAQLQPSGTLISIMACVLGRVAIPKRRTFSYLFLFYE
jgi:hypothetical protein